LLEDKNFYSNIWIDFFGILRAAKNNFKAWKVVEWASTISSGLIRNIEWINKKRSLKNKAKEFFLAIILNIKYSKNEILTAYLNNIYFWNLNYWISAASRNYFWKKLQNLTKAEQIALLTIVKNPTKYNPIIYKKNFRKRFEKILKYLKEQKLINQKEYLEILQEKLFFKNFKKNSLPYIVNFINTKIDWKNLKKIDLTVDYNLTKQIEKIAKNVIVEKSWKNMQDYGILLIDRKTSELLVMIWGYDYDSKDWQVNSTLALRQPGSTIKPFTYLLAFKDLWYSPDTILLDLPTQFETKDGNIYNPKNYSLKYSGKISLAKALSQSINVVSVKLLWEIWISRLYDFLKELKINSLTKTPDYYGLALTLWDWELSLFELVRAYSIFAYDGNFCEINIFKSDKIKCKKLIEKKYIDQIKLILTNRYFKLGGFPINSTLDFEKREVFVKTGTSRNFRDNWAIWFSDNYILWVWAWNKDWSPMKWVSWASWAWEIFKAIIKFLEPENDKIKEKIIFKNKKINFLEIISPLNKSIYEIDKSKKIENQKIKIKFETDIDFDDKKIYINNKVYKEKFWTLKKWNFLFEIILYKSNKEIKRKKSLIIVK
jgi:penicillin-binding protein 1C